MENRLYLLHEGQAGSYLASTKLKYVKCSFFPHHGHIVWLLKCTYFIRRPYNYKSTAYILIMRHAGEIYE